MTAHHGDAVAILQAQVVSGQELYVAHEHTADVYAVGVAQLQLAEPLAVERRPRDDEHAAFHIGIDGIPVYLLLIIVLGHAAPKEQAHGLLVLTCGDNEHVVTLLKLGVGKRNDDLVGTPQTGDDELQPRGGSHLSNGLSCHGRVDDDKLRYICLIVIADGPHLPGRLA